MRDDIKKAHKAAKRMIMLLKAAKPSQRLNVYRLISFFRKALRAISVIKNYEKAQLRISCLEYAVHNNFKQLNAPRAYLQLLKTIPLTEETKGDILDLCKRIPSNGWRTIPAKIGSSVVADRKFHIRRDHFVEKVNRKHAISLEEELEQFKQFTSALAKQRKIEQELEPIIRHFEEVKREHWFEVNASFEILRQRLPKLEEHTDISVNLLRLEQIKAKITEDTNPKNLFLHMVLLIPRYKRFENRVLKLLDVNGFDSWNVLDSNFDLLCSGYSEEDDFELTVWYKYTSRIQEKYLETHELSLD